MSVVICIFITSLLSSLCQCALEPKIVGGEFANMTEFSYAALLSIRCATSADVNMSAWICGSSILNEKLLLTAAHCVAECLTKTSVSVSVGHVHMTKGYRSSAISYLVHEEYYQDLTINDIGLVKLKTTLVFDVKVSRVLLTKHPPYNEVAYVAGWGVIDEENEKIGQELKFIDQHVWKTRDCIDLLNSIPRGSFCASSKRYQNYVAAGDSGSALVVRGFLQIGLVSYKKPKTSRNVIVYTNTGYFYKWITRNAKRLLCN